jgi:hypothetical protein
LNVKVVTWGNGTVPAKVQTPPAGCAAASSFPGWANVTEYPVYHDVFYYNPDVRSFIITTLTGNTPGPEDVITARELLDMELFLDREE